MNFAPPEWARAGAESALRSVQGNHYAHAKGQPRLRRAIRGFYGTQFGRELDVETEIVVTSGANEGESLPSRGWCVESGVAFEVSVGIKDARVALFWLPSVWLMSWWTNKPRATKWSLKRHTAPAAAPSSRQCIDTQTYTLNAVHMRCGCWSRVIALYRGHPSAFHTSRPCAALTLSALARIYRSPQGAPSLCRGLYALYWFFHALLRSDAPRRTSKLDER